MIELLAVSLIWAFSFGIIGNVLDGVDPVFLAWARLALAAAFFLPLLRPRGLPLLSTIHLFVIGAIQYGLMYVLLFKAFAHLESHEVALFTILTPIYVTAINDLATKRFHGTFLLSALLAVVGAAVIKYDDSYRSGMAAGFLIMQGSNLCFAAGQIMYRNAMKRIGGKSNSEIFAILYAGGLLTATLFTASFASWRNLKLDLTQIGAVIYLGSIASGLAFFLWNAGARKVNAGTLAVFNNLKIPLAMTVSLLVFKESADIKRLAIGGGIVAAALILNELCIRRKKIM